MLNFFISAKAKSTHTDIFLGRDSPSQMCLTEYRHPQDRVDAQTSEPEAAEHMLERHHISLSGDIVFLWQRQRRGQRTSFGELES